MSKSYRLVGLMGAHRVGKTTLMNELCNTLGADQAVPLLSDVAGVLASRGTSARTEVPFLERLEHQRAILKHHTTLWASALTGKLGGTSLHITDRTPLCFIGYALYDLPRNITPEEGDALDAYIRSCLNATCAFDTLVYVQPGITAPEAGKSASSYHWSVEKLDAMIQRVLLRQSIIAPVLHIPRTITALQTRVGLVVSQLKQLALV